ncbi:AAA family ATPase [Allosphingosinicella sp.]|uniref:AAA family ATPase n=1 Tax=Allosphingosinicella sp. TaxID=2823234 RepID=UPI002EF7E0E6
MEKRPLLVWINGAHGAGKSSVARALAKLLGGGPILDPEQIGFMLRRFMALPADFKDDPIWRTLTVETLAAASGRSGVAIVPMTLDDGRYREEIVGGLAGRGIDVRHFTLLATPRTLRRRLLSRCDWPGSTRWALRRIERSVAELEKPEYAVHVRTDGRRIVQIASEIGAMVQG